MIRHFLTSLVLALASPNWTQASETSYVPLVGDTAPSTADDRDPEAGHPLRLQTRSPAPPAVSSSRLRKPSGVTASIFTFLMGVLFYGAYKGAPGDTSPAFVVGPVSLYQGQILGPGSSSQQGETCADSAMCYVNPLFIQSLATNPEKRLDQIAQIFGCAKNLTVSPGPRPNLLAVRNCVPRERRLTLESVVKHNPASYFQNFSQAARDHLLYLKNTADSWYENDIIMYHGASFQKELPFFSLHGGAAVPNRSIGGQLTLDDAWNADFVSGEPFGNPDLFPSWSISYNLVTESRAPAIFERVALNQVCGKLGISFAGEILREWEFPPEFSLEEHCGKLLGDWLNKLTERAESPNAFVPGITGKHVDSVEALGDASRMRVIFLGSTNRTWFKLKGPWRMDDERGAKALDIRVMFFETKEMAKLAYQVLYQVINIPKGAIALGLFTDLQRFAKIKPEWYKLLLYESPILVCRAATRRGDSAGSFLLIS